MKILMLVLGVTVAGCAANSGVVAMGADTYFVSRQGATGFSGASTLKAEALQEANQYCQMQRKTMEVVNMSEAQPPFILGNYPKAEVQFKCLSKWAFILERRLLYIPVLHIDTNLINARQKLPAINQLEKWSGDAVILVNMSSTAHREAQAGGDPSRTQKANQQIYTATPAAEASDPLYAKIESALFPQGASDDNQRNDVKIVYDAAKYVAILITSDGASRTQPGGMLGNRHKLKNLVQILSPDEALSFVRQKIRERDEFNVKFKAKFGGCLPPWTGKD